MRRIGFWILISGFLGLLGQTGMAQESPLTLNVTSVPAEPGVVQVTLTNQSNQPVKVVQTTSDGQLQNLQLQFITAATGDTTIVTVDPFTPTQLSAPAGQLLTNLAAGEQLSCPLAINTFLPENGTGTLTIIYPSIYQTPTDTLNLPPRAQVWREDVQSNPVVYP